MSLETAYLLPGAYLLKGDETGFFETYRGVIETPTGKVSAYVKLVGNTTLANEVVSTLLGRGAGLPIPKGYFVHVSAQDYPESKFLKGQRLLSTIAYGSTNANALSFTRQFHIINDDDEADAFVRLFPLWPTWRDAVVFDEWIANCDRNVGNLLIGADNEVWLIDHSHAFTGPNWQGCMLRSGAYTKNRVAEHVGRCVTIKEKYSLGKHVNNLAGKFKQLQVSEIIDASGVNHLLSDVDVQALKRFLSERIELLPAKIANHVDIPNLFPVQ
ncbi:HipA family kinase [Duganella sp. S19_KUP01_CR8]|uniref:HipA family kinase n=1 Tax=Duganella sp. S19_KUP01_CR8 TaxID=3025502 RepID=UPI002FCDD00A